MPPLVNRRFGGAEAHASSIEATLTLGAVGRDEQPTPNLVRCSSAFDDFLQGNLVAIDPNNLTGTAKLTFADEFDTLNLWNGSSGTWATNMPYAPENGTSLNHNGDQEWFINANYGPTDAVNPWTISNGVLSLTAAKADPSIKPYINNYEYTSGLITTSQTFSQTYGYFEMRAQLPKGAGLLPAFWLVPTSGAWPPEIDVFEVLGQDPSTIYYGVHSMATGTRVPI